MRGQVHLLEHRVNVTDQLGLELAHRLDGDELLTERRELLEMLNELAQGAEAKHEVLRLLRLAQGVCDDTQGRRKPVGRQQVVHDEVAEELGCGIQLKLGELADASLRTSKGWLRRPAG